MNTDTVSYTHLDVYKRQNLAVLKRFTKFEPVNAIAARRRIAERLLAAGRYLV